MSDDRIVIVAAKRSAIGSFGKGLAGLSPQDLGAEVARAALSKIPAEEVDLVYLGNVLSAGLGQNIARQVALCAGVRQEVPAISINQVCGSGLYSIILGAQALQTGMAKVVLAGGVENMSRAPYLLERENKAQKLGHRKILDSMICDGLWDAFGDYHMGITAENIAKKWQISRKEQDAFALESQKKASTAQRAGFFSQEIVPISVAVGRGKTEVFAEDEYIRHDADASQLAALKPAFKAEGSVTAGNASGINDGAAILILITESYAKGKAWPILGRLCAWNSCGVAPDIMGYGPAISIAQMLEQQGLKMSDIRIFEINEAFAAQSLAVIKDLQIEPTRVNPWGGAIALGHPIGASGARIVCTLLSQMHGMEEGYSVASLCVGGGMGTSVLIGR